MEQPTSPKIDELEKQAEAIESNSGIMAKIKQWVASFIKFLKDHFNRNHKEDLTQTTATTITAIEANERELVPPATNLLDNVLSEKVAAPVVTQSVSSMEPPPPPAMNNNPSLQQSRPTDLLAAIRGGANLKKPGEQRKLATKALTPAEEIMAELANKLGSRRKGVAGEKQKDLANNPSAKFLQEFSGFDQERIEARARELAQDKKEDLRVAAALEAEKAGIKTRAAKTCGNR